jgi:hypothetical protein
MSVEFHVGAQVVCLDDRYCPQEAGGHLMTGRIYTIRKIDPARRFLADDGVTRHEAVGLYFEEVTRLYPGMSEGDPNDAPWGAVRFKPVRKTDISVFTAMLTPTKVTEDA